MVTRRHTLASSLLALLLGAGLLVGVSSPAEAAAPQIYGRVTDASTGKPISRVKVLLFDASFGYLRQTTVRANGVYQLPSPGAGSYHLQLVDGRPAYDTKAYAARLDIKVSIGTSSVQKNVRMQRGGAIGGIVKVRGKRAGKARVRAISSGGQVIEVTADKRGSYALGGLAKDDYRVFAYDARKRRVGASKLVRSVDLRTFRKASFDLRTRPGTIRGFLTLGGSRARGTAYVTAVNKTTGEYWVRKVSAGNISLRGLTPGPYRLQVSDTNGWFGRTFQLGHLRPGSRRNVTVDLSTRGGTLSGQVVDAVTGQAVPHVSVRLSDANGRTQAELPAAQNGTFRIGGTIRQQARMRITVFAYSTIQGHAYRPTVISPLSILNDRNTALGVIRLQRTADSG